MTRKHIPLADRDIIRLRVYIANIFIGYIKENLPYLLTTNGDRESEAYLQGKRDVLGELVSLLENDKLGNV